MLGWDMAYLIAVSEARNRHAAAHGCDGFRTPPFPMPPYREDFLMPPAPTAERGEGEDREVR